MGQSISAGASRWNSNSVRTDHTKLFLMLENQPNLIWTGVNFKLAVKASCISGFSCQHYYSHNTLGVWHAYFFYLGHFFFAYLQ